MINIRIFVDANGNINGFKIDGHADVAPRGYDIVCAGVSALSQSALMGLDLYTNKKFSYDVKSGMLSMKLIDKPDALTQAVLGTMLLGLKEIAGNYPESVHVKEHRR